MNKDESILEVFDGAMDNIKTLESIVSNIQNSNKNTLKGHDLSEPIDTVNDLRKSAIQIMGNPILMKKISSKYNDKSMKSIINRIGNLSSALSVLSK